MGPYQDRVRLDRFTSEAAGTFAGGSGLSEEGVEALAYKAQDNGLVQVGVCRGRSLPTMVRLRAA